MAAESDVAFSFVHGSFVTEGPFHDIDVAVYFVGLSDLEMSRRTLDLSTSLEAVVFADLLIQRRPLVDVRALNAAPLGFRYQVLRTGQLLTNRDDALRTEWTAATVSRYLDIKPLYEAALKEAMTSWH